MGKDNRINIYDLGEIAKERRKTTAIRKERESQERQADTDRRMKVLGYGKWIPVLGRTAAQYDFL